MTSGMKVVFVVGPTGTGKSEIASLLAEGKRAAILNCDSVQMHKGLSVGAAMPSPQQVARAPHELYGIIDAPEEITAGQYSRLLMSLLKEREQDLDWAFVVGGTGFYFQAVEKGMPELPPSDPEVRVKLEFFLENEGGEALWRLLSEVDPSAAAKISPTDHYRMVRALEVYHISGKRFSDLMKQHSEAPPPFPYPLVKIGLDGNRDFVRERIRLRTEKMLQEGLVSEVEGLLRRGLADWAPLASVGYRETVAFLKGEIKSPRELADQITLATQQLVKKQRTWFQRDKEIRWFDIQNEDLLRHISEHLFDRVT